MNDENLQIIGEVLGVGAYIAGVVFPYVNGRNDLETMRISINNFKDAIGVRPTAAQRQIFALVDGFLNRGYENISSGTISDHLRSTGSHVATTVFALIDGTADFDSMLRDLDDFKAKVVGTASRGWPESVAFIDGFVTAFRVSMPKPELRLIPKT